MSFKFLGGDFPVTDEVMFIGNQISYVDTQADKSVGSFMVGHLKRVMLEGTRLKQDLYMPNDLRNPFGVMFAVGDALTRNEEKHHVTFAAELDDGRKLVARANRFTLQQFQRFVYNWSYSEERQDGKNDLMSLIEAASAKLKAEKDAKTRYEVRGIIIFWILIVIAIIISAINTP